MPKILLVDDEPKLLRLLKYYLERLSFEVDACPSASHAWELFQQDPLNYALVVLDVRMPVIDGQELSARMLTLSPGLRLVFSSGYPFDTSQVPVADPQNVEFLQKPYTPAMLAAVLRRVLGHPSEGGANHALS